MGLFNRQPRAQVDPDHSIPFDAQQHEMIDVDAQDTKGHRHREYTRDRKTQRIIGEVGIEYWVRPLENEER